MAKTERLYVRVLLFLVYVLGVYFYWSRLGRLLLECTYRGDLDQEFDAEEIQKRLDKCEWRPDPWWQLGDLISYPRKFMEKQCGDCDEFAVAALSMGRHGIKWGKQHYFRVGLLTVNYRKTAWRLRGHNVALFRTDLPDGRRQYIHMGNKGIWGPFDTMKDAALSVSTGAQATPCGFRITTANLRKRIYHEIW